MEKKQKYHGIVYDYEHAHDQIGKAIWQVYDDRKGKYMPLSVTLIPEKSGHLVPDTTANSVQYMNLTTEHYIVTWWQSHYTSG